MSERVNPVPILDSCSEGTAEYITEFNYQTHTTTTIRPPYFVPLLAKANRMLVPTPVRSDRQFESGVRCCVRPQQHNI